MGVDMASTPDSRSTPHIPNSPDKTAHTTVESTTTHEEPITAVGGTELPNSRQGPQFLSLEMAIHLITNYEIHAVESVPRGIKENVYFLVENQQNINRWQAGKHCEFWDDCGSWNSTCGSSPKVT